jgi:hypothetical protein
MKHHQLPTNRPLATAIAAAAVVLLASVVAAAAVAADTVSRSGVRAVAPSTPTTRLPQDALRDRFNMLSHRHSNRCALRPLDVNKLSSSRRLQGSCCTPMVYAHYVEQVRGLVNYRSVPQVPRDPYDVSVAQAKQLLADVRSIHLNTSQKATYRRAMKLADEHGPCCCQCWRWSAFEGQARYLIARRGWSAAAIAKIWDLEDGCGGKG